MPVTKPDQTAPAAGSIHLNDDAETARLGAALGAALAPGDVVLLTGGLGAGKTALARAAIAARLEQAGKRAEDIPSPTFTLVQVYEADVTIWHTDLYRLSDEDEIYELGLDEAFETAITFVEWPERLGGALPPRRLEIELSISDLSGRDLRWRAIGAGWEHVAPSFGAQA